MTDPHATACHECQTMHSRRLALLPLRKNAYIDFAPRAIDRPDPYCSDECRDGAQVRTALGKGATCYTCGTWAAKPIAPTHSFNVYCQIACIPVKLRKRELERW